MAVQHTAVNTGFSFIKMASKNKGTHKELRNLEIYQAIVSILHRCEGVRFQSRFLLQIPGGLCATVDM